MINLVNRNIIHIFVFKSGGGMFKQPRSSSENNVVRIHYGVNV
jgi:hypothetical protein